MKKIISLILLTIALLTFTSCKEPCNNSKCHSGTIQCNKCKGGGLELCPSCKGTKTCNKCYGTGTYLDSVTCTSCDGDGFFINPYNWQQMVKCSKCNGLGVTFIEKECSLVCDDENGDGKCDDCDGSGIADNAKACEQCNGTGKLDCPYCEDGYIK